ncbi:tRNA-splicing endonuclease subunit Sen34 [Hippocampus comes]|uniref:tRNA-splicing endonuclease subunit Sen34 n=1 Tax=Hippocampus comes TaxID=109280 RepID=A0A3Q2YIZ6_HIPCM|nr:PREDICTED: tRNA-splicing endonuclease subunit Sen34 [Hippocampus comes]XP_019729851.1 PREDICTED: tRNA-splicing endonuclease subunit Sen34 [Hippocampus comes]XP_019729852.1 PREDICTED: tRNA-splicing endonuclease subunit Sen34 [Hippocampus comes]
MSSKEAESPAQAMHISQCDSAPLLWHTDEVAAARSLGLVGALLGSLPRTPRQNVRLGRPLLLLPEEERFLGDCGALTAISQSDVGVREHARQVALYEETLERSYQEQQVLALQDRKAAVLRALNSSRPGSEVDCEEDKRRRLETLERHFSFQRSALMVQLNTARVGPAHLSAGPASCAIRTPAADAKYQVFLDLRRRGFYLTSAGKFGGDFLVYPGDPLRFHAHFICVCVRADERVPLSDLLAAARLGSNVKKTLVLCSPHCHGGGVTYSSLQWSGMI